MSNKEGLTAIKKLLISHWGEDTDFVSLSLISADDYAQCLFDVARLQNKDHQLIYMYISNQVVTTETSLKGDLLKVKPLKVKDIDIDSIIAYKEKAASLIVSKSADFIAFQIKEVSYSLYSDGRQHCDLELVAKKKDISPTIYGKRVAPKSAYFSFHFTVDISTGEVVCVYGLDD
ncbi:MAG: hypothetical protein CSA04_02665 [Bacteroidetes bacterium]|nr:MAG: hypothetical protein CSA04_02665 [Bacteroidota bacterium]